MTATVSKSPKPDNHELSRQERDNSYSTGAGRKAVEKPKIDGSKESNCDSEKETLKPPIGLDNETKGDNEAKCCQGE